MTSRRPAQHGCQRDHREGESQWPAEPRPGGMEERVRRVTLASECEDEESHRKRAAGAEHHQERAAVLLHGRAVALEAVDAVEATLDLAHRRRTRDGGADQ